MTEKVSISKEVTIDGAGFTITGKSDDANENIEVRKGTLTMKNAKLTGFGSEAETASVGAIQIPATATGAKVVADNLTVEKFNRAAFDLRVGSFEIKNCTINCNNDAENRLNKGVLAWDSNGTIENCAISGVDSTYVEWSANGIEVYGASKVDV